MPSLQQELAISPFRRLVAGFSPGRPEFGSRPFLMGLMMYIMSLGWDFLKVLRDSDWLRAGRPGRSEFESP